MFVTIIIFILTISSYFKCQAATLLLDACWVNIIVLHVTFEDLGLILVQLWCRRH